METNVQCSESQADLAQTAHVPFQFESEVTGKSVETTPHSLIRNPPFVWLTVGQFIAFLGSSVYTLALMWEMKLLTGSTVMMSAVSIASLVPLILLGPLFGVLVDRWSKRSAMLWSDVIRAVVVGVLTLALAAHSLSPWMLLVGAALNSAAGAVYSPANTALIPLMVGRENLQRANSISQSAMLVTQIIGPFLGGFLVGSVSMTSAFLLNAVTYLCSVASLVLVIVKEPARAAKPLNARQMWAELGEGLSVVRDIRLFRTLIPVSLIANFLFAPFELILIQYCTEVLHGGAELYGILGTFLSVGMLVGAALAGVLASKVRKGLIIACAFPLSNVFMFLMAFTHTTWVALALASLFGVMNMLVNVSAMTIIQSNVPQEKMGRVFGSFGLMVQGAQPFAQAAAGFLLSAFSVPTLIAGLAGLDMINALVAASKRDVRMEP